MPVAAAQSPEDLPPWWRQLARGLGAIGNLWVLGLMVLIMADVIGRNLLGAPVRGTTELIGLSIVGIVFLLLADALLCGRLTRSEVWLAPLRQRRPAIAFGLLACFDVLGAVFMALVLISAVPDLVDAFRVGEYVGALGDFRLPLWPVRLLIVVGLSVTALSFLLLALAHGRRAFRRASRRAEGVP
jgi:TRAP-type mannitol/chloroaromatic compound transport system permease small subunit